MTEAFRIVELAAGKQPKGKRRKGNPVTVVRVNSRVWAEAQRISGGDPARLTIVSRTTVIAREGKKS